MKTELVKIGKAMAICIAGIFVAMGLFQLMDVVMNGVFKEWFYDQFTYLSDNMDSEGNIVSYSLEIDWNSIRFAAVVGMAGFFSAAGLAAWIVSRLYAEKRRRQCITQTSRMIHEYMTQERDAAEVFPTEYAEVAAQITEIKANARRSREILREEAQRKNDLIAYLAHDLKTPLTSVIGYLSLLEEVPEMPEAQRAKYVGITLEKAQRLEKLINEFFEITRYNLQQIILEKETVDLYYLLVQMADEFYPILKPHGNTIRMEAGENLTVCADPVKLARVFNNILKNAVAYSYENSEIVITAQESGDAVNVTIRNQGPTIPPQKLETIFEKFFRLDEARGTNTGGAGLGLAIAKEIVTLHGGTITAHSEAEEVAFVVTLPLKS